MNIKQSYLKDKALAIKNGHKVSNELDDFLMWCTANKLKIAEDFTKDSTIDYIVNSIEGVETALQSIADTITELSRQPEQLGNDLRMLAMTLSKPRLQIDLYLR